VQDAGFSFPGIPQGIDYAIAFAVFTHLPLDHLAHALTRIHSHFPHLHRLLFTVFLAPADHTGPLRQPDGVVTHATRAPYHFTADAVLTAAAKAGFSARLAGNRLPRGQILCIATHSPSFPLP